MELTVWVPLFEERRQAVHEPLNLSIHSCSFVLFVLYLIAVIPGLLDEALKV